MNIMKYTKRSYRNKILIGLFFCSMLSIQATGHCASHSTQKREIDTLDRVVAIVNNEAIPESELNKQMQFFLSELRQTEPNLPPQNILKKQVLDKLVLEKLQLQKAKETGISVPDAEIDKAMEDIASRNNMSLKQLQTAQEERGVPLEKFREAIKNQIIISRLQQRELGQNVHVTPEEIDQFLNSAKGQDQSGAEYRLTHILIPLGEGGSRAENRAKTQVDSLTKQIKNGEDFSKLAVQYSSSESAPGGDLGFRKAPELPTLFAEVVPSLKLGEVRGPIRNEGGYHFIKLVEKRIDGVPTDTQGIMKIHVRQILLHNNDQKSAGDVQAELNKLREQCLRGADFAKLAMKHSEEARSQSKGGDLGWITAQSVDSEFFHAISALRAGEISQPFQTENGWQIVQVLESRQTPITSEAARNRAQDLLFQRKVEDRVASWLKRVRDEAEVQIYLNEEA